ncbi:hypothetical protein RJ641_006519 [Dillenia turbinata]|uniref:Uncharacterized protein n=1 Tax=Dillenia turbinata TaxID=194707 RepID=A0AAN8VHV7_9MAGN
MMVLEMVGGRKNLDAEVSRTSEIYFPRLIYKCLESQENSRLVGIENGKDEEISERMILVSLWCIQTNPADRPSMSKVIEMLEGSLESLHIPPKPYLCSSTRSSGHSTQISS